ncbi:hypothetical protein EPO56_01245 [Patescibacteria group bacterium]|nr:MAG: hypothetical protein EPO56_01245 [Patescibacteria group bacterium]
MKEGVDFVCDMSEGQLLSLIRDKNFPAIHLWLRKHHPRYADKVEISGRIEHKEMRELSAEEKELIEKSLRLAFPREEENGDAQASLKDNNNYDHA